MTNEVRWHYSAWWCSWYSQLLENISQSSEMSLGSKANHWFALPCRPLGWPSNAHACPRVPTHAHACPREAHAYPRDPTHAHAGSRHTHANFGFNWNKFGTIWGHFWTIFDNVVTFSGVSPYFFSHNYFDCLKTNYLTFFTKEFRNCR